MLSTYKTRFLPKTSPNLIPRQTNPAILIMRNTHAITPDLCCIPAQTLLILPVNPDLQSCPVFPFRSGYAYSLRKLFTGSRRTARMAW